jgi:hypothetical protein
LVLPPPMAVARDVSAPQARDNFDFLRFLWRVHAGHGWHMILCVPHALCYHPVSLIDMRVTCYFENPH